MFITPDMTVFGGRGFSVGGGGGVLKTASGYPVTLTKTLAKLPESIAVKGASGGVGDKTANLFDKSTADEGYRIDSHGDLVSNTSYAASKYIAVEPNTVYCVNYTQSTYNRTALYDSNRNYIDNIVRGSSFTTTSETAYARITASLATLDTTMLAKTTLPSEYEHYGYKIPISMQGKNLFDKDSATWANGKTISSTGSYSSNSHRTSINKFPISISTTKIRVAYDSDIDDVLMIVCQYDADGVKTKYQVALQQSSVITLEENTTQLGITFYTSGDVSDVRKTNISSIIISEGSSALPYEPYINKTINLYSDRKLAFSVYRLTVYPKTKEAKVLNQNISGLQDWSQDWKIPKADSLIVSAGTTVAPSSMEIQYYGKR